MPALQCISQWADEGRTHRMMYAQDLCDIKGSYWIQKYKKDLKILWGIMLRREQ